MACTLSNTGVQTGCSTADLAIILIDARAGLLEQTHRHSFIAHLLGIKHMVVCINKMDLVEWDEARYNEIVDLYRSFSSRLDIPDIRFIPISALAGSRSIFRLDVVESYRRPSVLYSYFFNCLFVHARRAGDSASAIPH